MGARGWLAVWRLVCGFLGGLSLFCAVFEFSCFGFPYLMKFNFLRFQMLSTAFVFVDVVSTMFLLWCILDCLR